MRVSAVEALVCVILSVTRRSPSLNNRTDRSECERLFAAAPVGWRSRCNVNSGVTRKSLCVESSAGWSLVQGCSALQKVRAAGIGA